MEETSPPRKRRSLRICLTQTVKDHPNESNPPPKKPKTSAERSREYRQRVKDDEIRHKIFRLKENERHAQYRSQLTEEQRKANQIASNIRVRRCRDKKRAQGVPVSTYIAPKTRRETEGKREYWRNTKALKRASRTPEERDEANRKRREDYAGKKKRLGKEQEENQQALHELPIVSNSAPSEPSSSSSSQPSTFSNSAPPEPAFPEPSTSSKTPSTSSKTPSTTSRTPTSTNFSTPSKMSSYKKNSSRTKAIWRLKQHIPKDKDQAAEVISTYIDKASPASKSKIHARMGVAPQSRKVLDFLSSSIKTMKDTCQDMKQKRNKKDLKTRKVIASVLAVKRKYTVSESRGLGLSYKLLKRASSLSLEQLEARKKRKDAVSSETQQSIEDFYRRGEISQSLPDARSARKGKSSLPTMTPMRVMERSLNSAYEDFKDEHPQVEISFTKFRQLRPHDILPSTKNKIRGCVCECCENVSLKLDALRRFAVGRRVETYKDIHELSRSTLCPKGQQQRTEYERACLDRECINCGTSSIEGKLRPLLEEHSQEIITFKKWKNVDYTKDGKQKKKMIREKQTATATEFVAELVDETNRLSVHLFNAKWQGRQYDLIARNPPLGSIVVCQDFAENFSCWTQDEAQGKHWCHELVTLHASFLSYRCPEADCDVVTNHSLVFVSDDMKHCHDAVHAFNAATMDFLPTLQVPVTKVIFFSDGAPTQYKNKTSFCHLSNFKEDFEVPAERHFFGSRHGKGPCDREFGTLKKAVNGRIKARQADIETPRDFFDFCQANYTKAGHSHNRRSFLFISEDNIKRNLDRCKDLKPLPQTRQLHCIQGVRQDVVTYRNRSCFSDCCIGEENEVCLYSELTGPWGTSSLRKVRKARCQQTAEDGPAVEDDGPAVEDDGPPVDDDGPPVGDDGPSAEDDDLADNDPAEDGNLRLSMCVLVQYPDRWYPGTVKALDPIQVQFLKPHSRKPDVFVFPEVEDVQTIFPSMILEKNVDLVPCNASCREWKLERRDTAAIN